MYVFLQWIEFKFGFFILLNGGLKMLNFAICDDNFGAIDKLSKMLNSIIISHNLKCQISFSTTNPTELLEYVKNHQIHVLLLDIDLKSSTNGLDIAEKIREADKSVYIIFITGHFEYGMVAYKYKTFDFLQKPLTKDRFEETILRLYSDIFGDKTKYIKLDNDKTVIKENTIRFIKKDGINVIFHTDTRDYETYSSFSKISDMLPYNFVRCHKSYIVNMEKITDIDLSENCITLTSNDKCYIGPKYKDEFMEVLKNEYFTNNLVSLDIAQ